MTFKRALVSTSNKTGLLEFLAPLNKQGCEIVSTGGTSKYLKENGLRVKEVAEVTGFPEMMDGRVRTLHPKIHMGLLARSFVPEDFRILREHGVEPFDLVIVNLYPFEEAFKKGLRDEELIEQIDIGGPSLLRAAAKSYERVTVVCDPEDYKDLSETLSHGGPSEEMRRKLAVKVFAHCSYYDSFVARALGGSELGQKVFNLGLRLKSALRYGENPHQKASWYEDGMSHSLSLGKSVQHQGKELSYNNILDLEAAVGVVQDFDEPACAIIKHLSPCGVAVASSIEGAYKNAFNADPVSAFGGIVALNRPLTASLASEIVGPFLECVIAPRVDSQALEILGKKKNLRVLALETLGEPLSDNDITDNFEVRGLRGGALIQTCDGPEKWSSAWKIVGEKPSESVKSDLIFAQKVVRHVKSNAIVIAKEGQTLGICGGQTNRVDSVKMAIERTKGKATDSVLGSDAFFPFSDSIELASLAGVKWIIQPGGSLKDAEVEAAALRLGVNMVITGVRHFKH